MKKLALVLALLTTATISYADPTPTTNTASATMPVANTAPAGTPTTSKPVAYIVPSPPDIDAKAYVLIDANSGKVLATSNADARRQPASLTKLMTIYIAFRELAAGHIQLTDQVTISENAWKTGGSRMFVGVGSKVPLEDLLQGAIVASGNDSTTALAEYIGGTEPVFVQMMNQQAKQLGMNDTNYTDATGLPNPDHYSTANDLAKLANAIVHNFPQYYHYFGEKWFTWNGIRQPNRNRLLWRDDGVDGMKTGHTDEAGYCLIGSAQENGMRLISVVLGAPSENGRIEDSESLLKYGFRFYET
ncbi:MAG: D-alanyl-D-alanine carboxypeptidase, partial [Gammaproteobacteria bacterium]|nr:D-alanyl-D-alanine carboxypeptidase [Gammaproteobacteria bacterium]